MECPFLSSTLKSQPGSASQPRLVNAKRIPGSFRIHNGLYPAVPRKWLIEWPTCLTGGKRVSVPVPGANTPTLALMLGRGVHPALHYIVVTDRTRLSGSRRTNSDLTHTTEVDTPNLQMCPQSKQEKGFCGIHSTRQRPSGSQCSKTDMPGHHTPETPSVGSGEVTQQCPGQPLWYVLTRD